MFANPNTDARPARGGARAHAVPPSDALLAELNQRFLIAGCLGHERRHPGCHTIRARYFYYSPSLDWWYPIKPSDLRWIEVDRVVEIGRRAIPLGTWWRKQRDRHQVEFPIEVFECYGRYWRPRFGLPGRVVRDAPPMD
jgi:hypothetical protein